MKTERKINKEGKKKINLKAHAKKSRPIKNENKINSHKAKTRKTSKGEEVKSKYINKNLIK